MINTERLILRPIHSKDNQNVFAYRSDAETNKYQGWIAQSLEEMNAFILKNPNTFNTPNSWFQLVIVLQNSHTVIGDIGIHFIGENNQQCELGCTLNKEYHGNGFAQEALNGVIEHLFTTLYKHRITASIDPRNTNSITLFNRLNFRKEAHFKQSLFFKGEWVDDVIYACLKSEWGNKKEL